MRSTFWDRTAMAWLAAALTCASALTVSAQSINGRVVNNSEWRNDESIFPPHWYVAEEAGAVDSTLGRIVVALYDGAGALITLEHLAPADPSTQIVLSTAFGLSYVYTLGNGLAPGDYFVRAWVDGNGNLIHDEGEPFGGRAVTVSGDSSVNGIEVRISDDSDRDTLEDWWEVHWFGDLTQSATSDYDNDGLSNRAEYDLIVGGLDIHPNDWDTDGDRMDDGWELFYTFDPTSATGVNGANGDPDNDNLGNLTEYRGADGLGPRQALGGGIAGITGSTDAMNPRAADSDDDGAPDFNEFVSNLTHPVHPMDGTNFFPRSLDMAVTPAAGVALPDPHGARFGFPDEGGTVEFWIYPESDGDGRIYDFPAAPAGAIRISLENYRPKADILMGGITTATVGGTNDPAAGVYGQIAPLATGVWSHVAFVWAPQINSIELYVDGILLIAKQVFVYPDLSALSAPVIAADMDDGFLDELRVWNYPRGAADVEYWHDRIYPAPGYVRIYSGRCSGSIQQNYGYGVPLLAYYRFDDAGAGVEDFAVLNSGMYPIADSYAIAGLPAGAVSAAQAVSLLGSDDADGDGVPEWWNELNKLERYPVYEETAYGPIHEPCPEDAALLRGFKYFRAMTAYASIGAGAAWREDESDPASQYYAPKTVPDFLEGHRSSYVRYVYLHAVPRQADLSLFTPGMLSTILYVNGRRVTPVGAEADTGQAYDIASHLNVGRNMVYVRCVSTTDLNLNPARGRVNVTAGEYLACDPSIVDFLDCDGNPYKYERAMGKFDAQLLCDGRAMIVRGDLSRNDPRSVWHCQFWSHLIEDLGVSNFPIPDDDGRALPGNLDYGAINHAESFNNPLDPDGADDGLDAFYEYICRTNPRDRDSNNNGIPDGEEDFDGDGLYNGEEQQFGSHPWLPDSDDDRLLDGADASDTGHPASSLIPRRNLSVQFDGAAGTYLELARNRRFALYEWTIEAWVNPDADEADGGVVLRRQVTDRAVNYELGITAANKAYVRYVPNFGLPEVVLESPESIPGDGATWTHLAAGYFNRELNLYVNGTNVATRAGMAAGPAVYAGGPIEQRVGAGLKGRIDELRIWDVERDRLNIATDMDHVLSGIEPHLVGYYRFDDATSFSNAVGTAIGTSLNNTAVGDSNVVAWTWGQVEDYVGKYANDWWDMWRHSASIVGTGVTFSTNSAVVGPPSLQVFIDRPSDEALGARWSVNGGATWNKSGTLLANLEEGDHTISFNDVDGWLTPSAFLVTLVRGVSTVTNVEYVRPASLRVELNNNQTVITNAAWRLIPDGAWNAIGAAGQVDGLTPGVEYFVDLRELPGWVGYAKPTNTPFRVVLAEEEARQIVTQYDRVRGNLLVLLAPNGSAAALNGRWQPTTGTNWYQSGETVSGLEFGQHVVRFLDFAPAQWTVPADITIAISNAGETVVATGVYARLPQPTAITGVITPPAAATGGGQWRIGSGTWQNSGAVVNVDPGPYTISFRPIDGWQAPGAVAVTAVAETLTTVTGGYYRVRVLGGVGGADGQFRKPRGIDVGGRYVYVADSDNHRVQAYDRVAGTWETLGGQGGTPGTFQQPFSVAVSAAGDLWVADTGNHRVQRLSAVGGEWNAWGGRGDGVGQFNGPYGIAVDAAGAVYVADYFNSRIQKRSPAGEWSVLVRAGDADGRVRYPGSVTVGSDGLLYVSDYNPNATGAQVVTRVQSFTTAGAFVGVVGTSAADEGALVRARGLDRDVNGVLYVADAGGHTIRRLVGETWSSVLGGGALNGPFDVSSDLWANLFIADTDNNRILMLPIDDTDMDGIPDADETGVYGTSPTVADTDGDGFSDSQELLASSDPLDWFSVPPVGEPAPAASVAVIAQAQDFDGDGSADVATYDTQAGVFNVILSNGADEYRPWGMNGDVAVPGDYTGSGTANLAVFRPANGTWYIRPDAGGAPVTHVLGDAGDVLVPGDYDGDGATDPAVLDRATFTWRIRRSSDAVTVEIQFGAVGDVPVPGDYDRDGAMEPAVFRPSLAAWFYRAVTGRVEVAWGVATDIPAPGDYDGDGFVDIASYRPSTGVWRVRRSGTGATATMTWGNAGDRPVPGDYDGDGTTDYAVYRAASREWRILKSGDGQQLSVPPVHFGWSGGLDQPVAGVYEAVGGAANVAVFRPVTGVWYIRQLATGVNTVPWGAPGDIPVAADYDGDGLLDPAVLQPSTYQWRIKTSGPGADRVQQWGWTGDVGVPGDYDGDGEADVAVYRPSTGAGSAMWYIRRSDGLGRIDQPWGWIGDVPVPGDYDGDGITDIAVFRPAYGATGAIWFVRKSDGSGSLVQPWGWIGDQPVPADYDGDGLADIAIYRNGAWHIRRSSDGLKMRGRDPIVWGAPNEVAIAVRSLP